MRTKTIPSFRLLLLPERFGQKLRFERSISKRPLNLEIASKNSASRG
jgi:hypothetical protein